MVYRAPNGGSVAKGPTDAFAHVVYFGGGIQLPLVCVVSIQGAVIIGLSLLRLPICAFVQVLRLGVLRRAVFIFSFILLYQQLIFTFIVGWADLISELAELRLS